MIHMIPNFAHKRIITFVIPKYSVMYSYQIFEMNKKYFLPNLIKTI